tara:strand:- start:5518 stop:6207 length:690 start_codon:yes stop_codon:yes gene_type:complete
MTKLCPRGKAAAKRKFKVYPSAYANAYASKICAGKIKDPSGTKRKDWGPKKAKKGRMFTAAEVRALDEAKSAKNYKKKDRIESSGDKDRIKLMKSNLRRYKDGKMIKANKGMSVKGDDARDIRKVEEKIGASRSSKREKKIMKAALGLGLLATKKGQKAAKKFMKTKTQMSPALNYLSRKEGGNAKIIKRSNGGFTEKLQPYSGTYIKGNLAGHEVSNPSLSNYYKDLI